MAQKLSSATWRETLDNKAPWWGQMVDAAIGRLNAPLPESHAKKEMKESRLSWMSGDPILHSLDLLDDVLAIDPSPHFDGLQNRLIDTVTSRWNAWPPFTRASALSCLRPWYWSEFPRLRTLLSDIFKSETHPVVLSYAVDRLVDLAWAKPTPEIPEFIRRSTTGGHADSLQKLSHQLGVAVARKVLPLPSERVVALDGYYRECMGMEWPDAVALSDFLYGALAGIIDTAEDSTTTPDEVWDAWLAEIDQIATRWPFDTLGGAANDRFPVNLLLLLFKDKASADERSRLFVGLAGTFETILRSGDLATFCSLHHDLKGLISGRHRFFRGGSEKQEGLQISDAVESVFPRLASASVDRVAAWAKEGKTTDDNGWINGLDGRDSSELVKCCLEASRDKPRMKRMLMPTADALANAGKARVSGDLRAYLRKM